MAGSRGGHALPGALRREIETVGRPSTNNSRGHTANPPSPRTEPWHVAHGSSRREKGEGRGGYDVTYSDPPPWGIVFSWQTSRSQPADLRSRRPPMRSRGWPTALASCRWTQPRCPTSRSGADAPRATTSQLSGRAENGASRYENVDTLRSIRNFVVLVSTAAADRARVTPCPSRIQLAEV